MADPGGKKVLAKFKAVEREQKKAIRKVIKAEAMKAKKRMKMNAHKISGALRMSIADKIKVSGGKAYAVIGVRSRWAKMWQGIQKTPNRYASVQERETHFIADTFTGNEFAQTQKQIQDAIEAILK